MKRIFIIVIIITFSFKVFAQSILLNPQSSGSAIMEVNSPNRGLQIPRVSSLPVSPVTGTVLYDTNANLMKYWNGTAWIPVQNGASGTGWVLNSNNIYNNNTGNIGVGTNTPSRKLEINSGTNGESGIYLSKMLGTISKDTNFATVNSATGLAKGNNQNIYISDFSNNRIYYFVSDVIHGLFLDEGLNGPHDLTIGPDGFLYVANFYGNYVLKVNLDNHSFTTFASGFSNPVGLTFDNSGNLYVTNFGNGTLSKVAPGGSTTHNFATGLTNPYGCVFDSLSNKIFIANYGANEVAQIDASIGGIKTTFKAGVDFCTGITRNNYGDIFVAQAVPNKIVRITAQGVMTDYASTTYPFDIIFDTVSDRTEDMYVANQTVNKVSRISPNYYSSLLALSPTGDVKKKNLAKNGFKFYIDNTSGKELSGIYGEGNSYSLSAGAGVLGYSEKGHGVIGNSYSASGVLGTSTTGIGVRGESQSGDAGYFIGKVQVTGNLCALNVSCPSDLRLKKSILPLSSSLTKLTHIKGYNYYWKDSTRSDKLQTGVIAQELQKIFPELINQEKDGFLSVNYNGLIPHLIEAVKELDNKNAELQTRNTELEKLLKQLKSDFSARLEAIEASLKPAAGK